MHKARAFFFVCAGIFLLALSYHLGTRDAAAQAPAGEVAVLSGALAHGETIPLPSYRDGVQASESDCRWMVSINYVHDPWSDRVADECCYTVGRVVVAQWCVRDCNQFPLPGIANYLIVAVRGSGSGPVPAQSISIGQLKTKYAK